MMDENINESAEIQEVAEPETEALESAETQEVAEPDTADNSNEVAESAERERTEADARFAEMRRQNQQLDKEKQQLEREAQMMREALSRYFEGETAEELSINANAYAEERDPDEYRQEWERQQDYEKAIHENEELRSQMLDMRVREMMREGLREIQEIDPSIKSLDELGSSFAKMISAGLSNKEAYYATLAMNNKDKVFAPDPIGRVSDNRIERDYYTSEELDNLTDEELDANWDKVMRSMKLLPIKK